MNASESRAGPASLMVIGVVAALACVSAIGAATTLVVIAVDQPVRHGPAVVAQAQAGPAQ